ncbi:glutathione S-transferase N-terminal domain-containing protein [Thermomonas sp.]|uniref:glutathione S-transferase family protein n=1 Tax=Thermomonas sp. TaxID=1971895 RepID=UPI0026333FC9|nr:glutathione S-transferase N-terminal domain-containing protein [Thermomonas sp.]MCO5054469.1 glutathione S-transferase N-terminal domain-containing protein [Thermomonas sp.]
MKLYTSPGACSLADHITLEWIGQPYEYQIVKGEQRKAPEFLKLNPAGAVPALQVGDWVLTQNTAILHYLMDRYPDCGLLGDGTPEGRAEVNRWLGVVNSDVHPAFKPLFGATAYLEDAGAIKKSHDNAHKLLRTHFERVDAQLAGKDWVTGSRSIADPYWFVVTQWAKKIGVDLSGLDNLARFDAHMTADPGVQKAMKDEGLI